MRSRTPLPARERGHFVPFAGAAALFAALCIFARTAALVLAAAIAAPLPLAQTVLWLGRQGAGQHRGLSCAAAGRGRPPGRRGYDP